MKAVILAGGRGTRLAEETQVRPKPMVEIGGRPILWHIMQVYAHHGIHDFVVCAGYKGYVIKEYFANLMLHHNDVTFDFRNKRIDYLTTHPSEAWSITVIDTGETTQTGGRLKRIAGQLPPDEPFCLTYGDGLSDVDIAATVAFHRAHGRLATMTVVRPPARFGTVDMEGDKVVAFREKHQASEGYVNGGFFVLMPAALDTIDGDETPWEGAPLERLAAVGQLMCFRHDGFWQAMDTLRDRLLLEDLWQSGRAPWKSWS
jgi:glucose-1-phosphate cytidylyltransferase